MKIIKLIALAVICVITANIFAQSISNIKIVKNNNKIIISYDLTGKINSEKFLIELFVSEDGGATWKDSFEGLSGDIGSNIIPGLEKRIVWDLSAGKDSLKGSKIKFEIRANSMIDSGTPKDSVFEFTMDMVFVQGGTFTMGCTNEQSSDCESDEKPSHSVTLTDFYIGIYEVTQSQWKAVMRSNPSAFKDCDSCPVEQVSWNDVQEFLKKLNEMTDKTYLLPTEAQWEYAARGGPSTVLSGTYKFSGSNKMEDIAWYATNSNNVGNSSPDYGTHKVGTKASNNLDIFDMSGNVWEWCSDIYGNYNNNSQTDPKGATAGSFHVYRGGAWNSREGDCRVSFRNKLPSDKSSNAIGFRLVYIP